MRCCRYISYVLGVVLVVLSIASCSGEDCPINNTVMGKMVFYNPYDEPVAFAGTMNVSVVRPQGDSVVLNRKVNASEITFPLSYKHVTDTFILDYNDGMAYDSLYVSHINTPTLVSVDCGTAMFHTITSVKGTNHVIDAVVLKSSEVNYDERENIQIIYRIDD